MRVSTFAFLATKARFMDCAGHFLSKCDFLRDADVVTADSQYDAIEYPSRRGLGHTCADDTVQLAARAGAKQLFLFHHDPDHNDAKIAEMVARAQREVEKNRASLHVAAACEGAEVRLTRGVSLRATASVADPRNGDLQIADGGVETAAPCLHASAATSDRRRQRL
jgi:hypothetical protein